MAGVGEVILGLVILAAAIVSSLMAGSFPTGVTSYTNPGPSDATATEIGGRSHDEFHADNNDDLEQVMTKLGTGASTATANTVLRGTGAGTTAFGQIAAADIADNVITATQLATDSVGALELADNAVVNANVDAAAAIAVTKIAHVGAGNVLRSNGTTNVAGQVVTGDIANDTILNADINSAAAVVVSKLAAGGTANRVVATADGTTMAMQQIATAMIANDAVSDLQDAGITTSSPTTTYAYGGGSPPTVPELSISFSSTGVPLLLMFTGTFKLNTVASVIVLNLVMDGTSYAQTEVACDVANASMQAAMNRVVTPSAGTRALKVTWEIAFGGTATAYQLNRSFTVVELKK